MKLVQYGSAGSEKPGLIDSDGRLRDLSHVLEEVSLLQLTPERLRTLRETQEDSLPLVQGQQRLGVPYTNIPKIIAVGLNYSDHAREAGMAIPKEPILFSKAVTSINGPNDEVMIPTASTKVDWEVELGVVIGREAKCVSEEDALDYVAGYCIVNDVSERELQIERGGGQWFKGKSLDTFCPIGPYLVTADEIADPQDLSLWLDVNGVRRQTGNTSTMIFGVAYLIHYISQHMTLMPGDLIATGTPPGVGMGMNPPMYLQHGDLIELGIDGLGRQHQKAITKMAKRSTVPGPAVAVTD